MTPSILASVSNDKSGTLTATESRSSTATLSPSQSISVRVSLFTFSLLIPGNQILSAQTLIQNYIQQFVGNQSIVSVNASVWQNNVYTVTGQSSLQSVSDNFPNSVQYQELLNALLGNTDNAIQPSITSPSIGLPIGISIGSVLVIGLVATGVYFLIRNRPRIARRKSVKPVIKKKYTKPNHFVSASKEVVMVPNKYMEALETKKQRSKYVPLTSAGNTVAPNIPPPPPLRSPIPPPPPPSLQFYTTRKLAETNHEGTRNTFNPASRTLLTRKPSMSDVSRLHSMLPLMANPTLVERERSQSETQKFSRLPSMTKVATTARNVYHPTMNKGSKEVHIEVDPANYPKTQYLPLRSNSIMNLIKKFEKHDGED